MKIKIPLIPGVASYDLELGPRSLPGRLLAKSSFPVRLASFALLLVLAVVVGFGGWRLMVRARPTVVPPETYFVRVVPVLAAGQPAEEAGVLASVGHEAQQVAGGWEIEIPRAKLPADREVTFWASDPETGSRGSAVLSLGADPTPNLQLLLEPPITTLRGKIVDAEGRSLAGARVSVLGFGDEGVTTSHSGAFEVAAHRPPGERVRLHVEHPLKQASEHYCFAGSTECRIQLAP